MSSPLSPIKSTLLPLLLTTMAMMKLSFLLILSIASLTPQAFANCPCNNPKPTPPTKGGSILPPVPKLPLPPVPKLPLPPVPKLPLPPVPKLPLPLVPVPVPVITPILPPVPVVTPVRPKPPAKKPPSTGCPPAPAKPAKCPIDVLKLGACLDVLGNPIHIGDPAVDCCPLIAGLTSVQAALCLCTSIKAKVLGVKVFLPIAVELLVTCGKTPPPGYSCA